MYVYIYIYIYIYVSIMYMYYIYIYIYIMGRAQGGGAARIGRRAVLLLPTFESATRMANFQTKNL